MSRGHINFKKKLRMDSASKSYKLLSRQLGKNDTFWKVWSCRNGRIGLSHFLKNIIAKQYVEFRAYRILREQDIQVFGRNWGKNDPFFSNIETFSKNWFLFLLINVMTQCQISKEKILRNAVQRHIQTRIHIDTDR